jgi:formylglycine-generating enzyme required for sulfatase activity
MFNLPEPFAWVTIPYGEVKIGNNRYTVQPFQISKYPITNAQFALFLDEGGYQQTQLWTVEGWQHKEKGDWVEPRYWNDPKWNKADYPIVGISWYEALAFSQWLGAKTDSEILLPTEQQWQRAAQGDDGLSLPWGHDWDVDERDLYCNTTVYLPYGGHHPTPVNEYEGRGDSLFGVVDMLGNVWEWTMTENRSMGSDSATNDKIVLCGGWFAYAWETDLTARAFAMKEDRWEYYGFRLCRTLNLSN